VAPHPQERKDRYVLDQEEGVTIQLKVAWPEV